MVAREVVNVEGAPEAKGPYSHAVKAGNLMFVSGQIPVDPANGELIQGGAADETKQVMENLKTVIEGAGGRMTEVVKTTCYLANMDDFQVFNTVYAEFFSKDPPARACIQAGKLPLGVKVEVEAVVAVKGSR